MKEVYSKPLRLPEALLEENDLAAMGNLEVIKPIPGDLKDLMRVQAVEVIKRTLINSFALDRERATAFAEWIQEAHEVSSVPVGHIAALLATESDFRYEAQSNAGAIGPAQVIPRYWAEFCGGDLRDARQNVICGARALQHYREECPDWACAFKKYNVGPQGYTQAEQVPAMQRYLSKIRRNQGLLGPLFALRRS